jgi:hypothetical protein
MKKQILCAVIFGFIALFSYSSANAQSNSRIVADVPFDFYVGSKKMPAGEYVIEKVFPAHNKTTFSLRRKGGKAKTMLLTTPTTVAKKKDVTLSFNRYGNVYYLSKILDPFAEFGVELKQGKAEITLARQSGKSKRETVSVDLRSKQKTETAAGAVN